MSLLRNESVPESYRLNILSKSFYEIIKSLIVKTDSILEFGSSSGHVSFQLALEGYKVSLLDIREAPISLAKNHFSKIESNASFFVCDFLSHNIKYDFIWNSGLFQCLEDGKREEFIKHATQISNRLLLFYPENHVVTFNNNIPGVGEAKEYPIDNIPSLVREHTTRQICGKIKRDNSISFDYFWIYAWR